MRSLRQFEVIETDKGGSITLMAIDEDGYLWHGFVPNRNNSPMHVNWTPMTLPHDADPWTDRRTKLEKIEDEVRERDRVRERLGNLPGIEDAPSEKAD